MAEKKSKSLSDLGALTSAKPETPEGAEVETEVAGDQAEAAEAPAEEASPTPSKQIEAVLREQSIRPQLSHRALPRVPGAIRQRA